MASSMIWRNSSGGASCTRAAPMIVATNPMSIRRYGRAKASTRRMTVRPTDGAGAPPWAGIMAWGEMCTATGYGRVGPRRAPDPRGARRRGARLSRRSATRLGHHPEVGRGDATLDAATPDAQRPPDRRAVVMAEGMGFEPMVTRRPQRLSRPPHSSALATFRRRHYRRRLRRPTCRGRAAGLQRRSAKKRASTSAHSSARTPWTHGTSWLRRGSDARL